MKFRKKPVVIEAIQYTGEKENIAEMCRFCPGLMLYSQSLRIKTLEGIMEAQKGDWIIRGVKGEFYPIKDNIFQETYESIEP